MTNRLTELFAQRQAPLLNVYFTAGFPQLADTLPILTHLQAAGADLVEIGIPYSDPVADGPTIQASNQQALSNGMTLKTLFAQLEGMRSTIHLPVLLMGYLNPVEQFGPENFCRRCRDVGVDGLILPDLPLPVYQSRYRELFRKYGLLNTFLVTPQTREERIREIDAASEGFIYLVAAASVTGAKSGISTEQTAYFERIRRLNLRNPTLIGFGISNQETFEQASRYGAGAIIGSAFIKMLADSQDLEADIKTFIHGIKPPAHSALPIGS